ncbi:MAG: amidohydrolase family protein [Phycisphaerae bacterium]
MTTRLAPRFRRSFAALLPLLAGPASLAADAADAADVADVADVILVDASVVTMDPAVPGAQALALKDGRILAVGSVEQVLAFKGDATRVRDLDGQVVMPGFIDCGGSCLAAGLVASAVDVSGLAPGDEAFVQALAAHPKDPVSRRIGMALAVASEPLREALTRSRLDEAVRDMPAILLAAGGRVVVLNSKACEIAGVNAARSGTLEGTDAAVAMAALVASRPVESLAAVVLAGQQLLAARGCTTVAQAGVGEAMHAAFVRLAAARRMAVDVVAFVDGGTATPAACLSGPWKSASYANGYRVAGISITFDRELADTLDHPEPAAPGRRGVDRSTARDLFMEAYDKDWQVMADAHGREAIAMFVEVINEVAASKGPNGRRPLLVGADMAGGEQFEALLEPRVGVVFGPGRIAIDGDRLRDAMPDLDDAERLSPASTALSHRVPVALHSSAGFVDPLRVLEAAAGRRTSSGDILGPRERISVEQGFAAITRVAANLLGEDGRKGSLEVGKQADLVILSGDPLRAGPAELRQVHVVETIKAGRTVHEANGRSSPLRRRPGAAWVVSP